MEKFLNLSAEKQKTMIDAALACFGANGYKKTSVSDIASAAGVSKALIFHYFGSKKNLYLYLVELCRNIFMNEIDEKLDNTVTDFFERIKMTSNIEVSLMKRHPAFLSFLSGMYFEKDEEVKSDIKAILKNTEGFRDRITLSGIDTSKFKDDVDLKLVMQMLSWIGDGYAAQSSKNAETDYEALLKVLYNCLDMLKNNFYKGEYV